MTIEKSTAILIASELNECLGKLNALLFNVKDTMDEEEYSVLKRKIAKIMNFVDAEIISGLNEQHPDIDRSTRKK